MREQDHSTPTEVTGAAGAGEINALGTSGDVESGDIEAKEQDRPIEPSPLFLRLMATVDRRHLVVDKIYLRLVSEIAELLPDEEVALLALYFVPPFQLRFHSSGNSAPRTKCARQGE